MLVHQSVPLTSLFFYLAASGLDCSVWAPSLWGTLASCGARAASGLDCSVWAPSLWGTLASCGARAASGLDCSVGAPSLWGTLASCGARAQPLQHSGLAALCRVGS